MGRPPENCVLQGNEIKSHLIIIDICQLQGFIKFQDILIFLAENLGEKYRPSGEGGTRSLPATPHRLQNPKWPPGGILSNFR